MQTSILRVRLGPGQGSPHGFTAEDTHAFRSLSTTLADAGCNVVGCRAGVPITDAPRDPPRPPALVILPIVASDPLPPSRYDSSAALQAHDEEFIHVNERVIHLNEATEVAAPHELGVFFCPLDAHIRQRIEFEVERLLRE